MFEVERRDDQCRVVLRGEVTIYQVRDCYEALKPLLFDEQAMVLDLEGVTEMDTSGAQLLMWAGKIRAAKGLSLSLVHHSDAVTVTFERLGLSSWFDDPKVPSPDRTVS